MFTTFLLQSAVLGSDVYFYNVNEAATISANYSALVYEVGKNVLKLFSLIAYFS